MADMAGRAAWDRTNRPKHPIRQCGWPGCEEDERVNASGNRMRYCPNHCKLNVGRARRGMTYEEAEREFLEGGKHVTATGYIMVRQPGQYDAMIPEHRLVMERKIGRPLGKGESVHHINGDRSDNHPDNLELWLGPIKRGIRADQFCCPSCGAPYLVE